MVPEINIIISDKTQVANRLHEFGLTVKDSSKICEATLHGRSLSSELQPKTAEGQLKYIFGVEGLRETFLASTSVKYEVFSIHHIEGVFDIKNGRKIMFQMVDQACGIKEPKPNSKIGDAKKQLIKDSKQIDLFPEWEEEARKLKAGRNALRTAECWYLMISIDNNFLCCELSRPKSVENEEVNGFFERIHIFKYGDFKLIEDNTNQKLDDDIFEIKPTVNKK